MTGLRASPRSPIGKVNRVFWPLRSDASQRTAGMWILLLIMLDGSEPPQVTIDHFSGFATKRLCQAAETQLRTVRNEGFSMRTICLQAQ